MVSHKVRQSSSTLYAVQTKEIRCPLNIFHFSGMRLGLLNVKLAVLRILSEYKIELTKKLPLSSDSGMGVFLDGDVNLRYTKL